MKINLEETCLSSSLHLIGTVLDTLGSLEKKLDLVFDLIKVKTNSLRFWKGSRRVQTRLLSCWEEFALTLVRTRKGFDVHFLADTFGISVSQVSRIYNTWIIFLSEELSFLVPWPKQFQRIPNIRVIIDCCEFYIQKPLIPESQQTTWSSYKHCNTVKLLVGIPCTYWGHFPTLDWEYFWQRNCQKFRTD
jgi:hypothetical protein